MSPMSRPEMFPGSLSLIAALDGGASLAEAEVQSVSSRTSVFGRRKSFALGKDLARVDREQYLAEFERQFSASL